MANPQLLARRLAMALFRIRCPRLIRLPGSAGSWRRCREKHGGLSRCAALTRAVHRLRAVWVLAADRMGPPVSGRVLRRHGQPAMIGMGLTVQPALTVADEPTTALDVTVQQQALAAAVHSVADGVALTSISDDVAVVGQICDRGGDYAARIVQDGPGENCIPRPEIPRPGPWSVWCRICTRRWSSR